MLVVLVVLVGVALGTACVRCRCCSSLPCPALPCLRPSGLTCPTICATIAPLLCPSLQTRCTRTCRRSKICLRSSASPCLTRWVRGGGRRVDRCRLTRACCWLWCAAGSVDGVCQRQWQPLRSHDAEPVHLFLPGPQFPYTHHVECGVYLQRRQQPEQDGQPAAAAAAWAEQPAAAAASGGGEADEGSRGAKRKAEEETGA